MENPHDEFESIQHIHLPDTLSSSHKRFQLYLSNNVCYLWLWFGELRPEFTSENRKIFTFVTSSFHASAKGDIRHLFCAKYRAQSCFPLSVGIAVIVYAMMWKNISLDESSVNQDRLACLLDDRDRF